MSDSSAFSLYNIETVITILLVLSVSLFLSRKYLTERRLRRPPGPWGLPILGHLPFFGPSPPRTFARWRQTYGNVFRIRLGSWETVVLNGYDVIKEAADTGDDFSGRPCFVSQELLQIVNGGPPSFTFEQFGEAYLNRRKSITSALHLFTAKERKATEEIFIEEVNKLVKSLLQNGKDARKIKDDIQFAVGSNIYQFLFGNDKSIDREDQLKRIVNHSNKITEFLRNGNPFDVMPWLRYIMQNRIKAFITITSEFRHMIKQQIQDHVKTFSPAITRDLTDALIAADSDVNDGIDQRTKLVATLPDLQGAGFDTTNKTLQWLILYMAAYPEVQTRVHAEIDGSVGTSRQITSADRQTLVYTEATINEVLRSVSLSPFLVPKLTTCDTSIGGYDIERGTVVIFNQHSSCHEREFWGDPEEFRPERFITPDGKLDQTKISHVMTFGLGRRKCVGDVFAKMQTFLWFSTLMQRCQYVKPPDVAYDLDPVPGLSYSPKDFIVTVQER